MMPSNDDFERRGKYVPWGGTEMLSPLVITIQLT